MHNKLTLVIGGAGSGKSSWAENAVIQSGCDMVYVATAQAWDDEMKAKIDRHRHQRGNNWSTIEAPLDISVPLSKARPGQIVLLDCATMWLSNHLLAESDLAAEEERFITALNDCAAPVVVVTNEVGMSVVPENALARTFRDAQGRLNQSIAEQADLVVAVMAGLPLVLKGQI
ncbi:Adenosylcobinamide kinase [Thalassovita gelatinovora]|uniref:Bifunctional adenosylcobalamin biosynthesis protein n=1 Tax=Thalassovita gelatinovora TaxID=53501 RepID=A0A0P1FD83_THAGE|nr:bifunctional adenosylcobinamide kinase/adenosylcobinamide-phosphate guanylyltransferase [Thalassovita gelatinovora]QIZ80540.1 bifunctional adenosylcobinamide kinase/adenosylcobinamide-phosphate guanylyltransferase [Thalassovita gelatinovora]CUH66020.1 Adenosylcobinamide kinase [Thalassovita gelatinovora]SEQ75537.1 adenosylcobinamide kinase /adenosylcobinamide-phosphate guanylyltransferase [Thalassovita gelatinovora]